MLEISSLHNQQGTIGYALYSSRNYIDTNTSMSGHYLASRGPFFAYLDCSCLPDSLPRNSYLQQRSLLGIGRKARPSMTPSGSACVLSLSSLSICTSSLVDHHTKKTDVPLRIFQILRAVNLFFTSFSKGSVQGYTAKLNSRSHQSKS